MSREVAVAMCLAAALSGCAAGPTASRPDIALPDRYARDYRPDKIEDQPWWRGFTDPQLDQLVERALDDNFTVAAARERFSAAAALAAAERADLAPSLDGRVEADVVRNGGARTNTSARGALSATFSPDIFGRLSAEMRAAEAEAASAEQLVEDARRLIAASVALQYVELRRTEARLQLLEESTDLQQQTLRIVELRYGAGLSANLDVRRAAADLARTRAQKGLLDIARANAAHTLAVLVGEPPGALSPPAANSRIPEFAAGPPTGVPADLVRRRPDLLAAEAQLAAAAARIGVERADLYPSLTLPGQISIATGGAGGAVSGVVASLAAVLDLPLFDAGRRRAEVRAAEASAAAALADYSQALLEALQEVEGALVAIGSHTDRRQELATTVRESQAAYEQSNALYKEGLASLFDLLDSQRQLIASREDFVDSRAQVASSVIELYRALDSPTSARPQEVDG